MTTCKNEEYVFIFPRHDFISGIPRVDFYGPETIREEIRVYEVFNEHLGFSRLYTDKGELLILRTNGYGASWSCDNPFYVRNHLLMDARVVRFFYDTYIAPLAGSPRTCNCGLICSCEVDKEPMRRLLDDLKLDSVYLAGLRTLQIETVAPGKKFQMREYDGLEDIIFYNEDKWYTS